MSAMLSCVQSLFPTCFSEFSLSTQPGRAQTLHGMITEKALQPPIITDLRPYL